MFNEHEQSLTCPYCMQTITVLIEVLFGNQDYTEDCEVCCNPIEISYAVESGELTRFDYKRADE